MQAEFNRPKISIANESVVPKSLHSSWLHCISTPADTPTTTKLCKPADICNVPEDNVGSVTSEIVAACTMRSSSVNCLYRIERYAISSVGPIASSLML
jgi:hypothetical protein